MRLAPPVFPVLALALVGSVSSPARAEHGTTLELGYIRQRTAVTDATTFDADSVRFAFRVDGRYLHAGAEAEEGRLSGTTSLPGGAIARTTEPTGPESPIGGNTLSLRLVGGVHGRWHWLGLSAGLAAGVRDTWVSSDAGMDVAGRAYEPLLEARTRADIWLSPQISIGATANTDLREPRTVGFGLLFALHFERH